MFREERPEVVSHHAAEINVRHSLADPVGDAETNVLGTLRVLELARRHEVAQVIFSSTGGALYGEPERVPVDEDDPIRPTSPYGFHKYLSEQYLGYYRRAWGLNATVLRYGNVYGPRQDPQTEAGVVAIFIEAFLRGRRPTVFGDGTQVRDFVYVGDVADANLRVLGQSLAVPVHIASGAGTSVVELTERLHALTGARVDWTYGPPVPGEVHRIVLGIRARRAPARVAAAGRDGGGPSAHRRMVRGTPRCASDSAPPRRCGAGRCRQMVDKELLEILACPACKAPVVPEEDRLVCTACGRRYPVRDGIPVMLIEEAEPRRE